MKTKIFFTGIFILLLTNSVFSQIGSADEYSLNLVGRMWFESDIHPWNDTTGGSDCWGYTSPEGDEYAIMGVMEGIAFVKVPEMQLITVLPGPVNNDYYYHRDIKTYKHYAYAVAEMYGTNEGLMIMDLQYLPDSVVFIGSYVYGSDIRSHNLSIDTAKGFAYVLDQQYLGFRIIDLADPENPAEAGFVNTGNIHDVFARNDTVYVAEGYNGSYSIWDLSDKQNPQMIVRFSPPASGYAHNIWASDDGKFVMTTEETNGKTVKLWDISDIENPDLRGQYLGEDNIAHNTHLKGTLAFISHYASGVVVVDFSNPDSLKEIARYDTYGAVAQGDFYGNWGAFPFTGNDYVYASDLEGYLTVLKFEKVTTTGIQSAGNPEGFYLEQNYPNPFNPTTTIRFTIPAQTDNFREGYQVKLEVFDVLGNKVATLVNEEKFPGIYQIEFNASGLSSGVYYYKLTFSYSDKKTGGMVLSRSMLLLK
ncbi:MAG: hypothetical protein Kow0098_20190 [Ignavibacteriaceae bacterium]